MKIRSRIVIVGVSALAVTGGGTAAAAVMAGSPVDSTGVIHGCWANRAINGSHFFVLQDAGTSCPRGTTAISWNQQGPQGPQGPAGTSAPVDTGTITLDGTTDPVTCTLTNLSGPSKSALRAAWDNQSATTGLYGCLVSGFGSSRPIVFLTETSFAVSGTDQGPPQGIAYEQSLVPYYQSEAPGSVMIAVGGTSAGLAEVQWNFIAYPHN